MTSYQEGRIELIRQTNFIRSFIEENTRLVSPPLVPEIELYLATEVVPIWQKSEEQLNSYDLPPPFWAFAWAGGQALARFVLDNPELVRGKLVLDLASGSGIVAIASMKAGAKRTLASEIDEFALEAILKNAGHNGTKVERTSSDLLDFDHTVCDVILVGDLFYEKDTAKRCFAWLARQMKLGKEILIGDPGRSYLPKDRLEQVATYSVPVSRELEDSEIKKTSVWRLRR